MQGTSQDFPAEPLALTRAAADPRWRSIAIWLIASVLAVLSCALTLPAARLDGEYIPVGNDSLYHARRILDAVHDLGSFYQFDARIHVPEGSLLVWPWGYDYAMAILVRAGLVIQLSTDPMAILAWLPVAAVLISIGLLVLIARRLDLSSWPVALAALCMALAPTTQLLHGPGVVDHHFTELIFLLAALAAGLGWLRTPGSTRHAVALALTLGAAPAIHNGLFILQLPILATLFVFWLQGKRLPLRQSVVCAVLMLAATLAILVPSLPFRLGRFEFYTLSWFHLYVVACTATLVVLLSRFAPTRTTAALVLAMAAIMLLPIAREVALAQTFLAGATTQLQAIGEIQSPLQTAQQVGTVYITRIYSYLIFLAPLTFVLCLAQCWRERSSTRLLFWITAALGLTLLSVQLRLHYFGSFALYLPWLVVAHDFAARRPQLHRRIFLGASLAILLLYASVLRYQLIAPMPHSNDLAFKNLRPVFATLHKACAQDPGIVLADSTLGHYVRYFTECSVIANNFLLTPQQFAKVDEAAHLLSLSAAELAQQAPQVKYVLLRPWDMQRMDSGRIGYKFFYPGTQRLAADLLYVPTRSAPAGYRLLHEVSFADLDGAAYARLYRIESAAHGE
jgi:hypothetical protein